MCLWLSLFNSLYKAFAVWVNLPIFILTSSILKKKILLVSPTTSATAMSQFLNCFSEKKKKKTFEELSTHVVSSLLPCSSLTSLQPCISLHNFTSSPYVIHKVMFMLLGVIGPALIPGFPAFPAAFGTSAIPHLDVILVTDSAQLLTTRFPPGFLQPSFRSTCWLCFL